MDFERSDGFVLVYSPGTGWDIYAPAPAIGRAFADLLRLIERRIGVVPFDWDGMERRRGPWIGWVLERDEAEAKIDREKRERLFH